MENASVEPLEILEDALSDVGVWRFWEADLPDVFQVEFGGAQLYSAPAEPSRPPSGVVAIRFEAPSLVTFLTRRGATGIPADWPVALHEDRIKPFALSPDCFSLRSFADLDANRESLDVEALVGDAKFPDPQAPVRLFFMARAVGLVVTAQTMTVINAQGQLPLADVPEANRRWWKYWAEYWERRGTHRALPMDYACEVTIPLIP